MISVGHPVHLIAIDLSCRVGQPGEIVCLLLTELRGTTSFFKSDRVARQLELVVAAAAPSKEGFEVNCDC